MFNVINIVVETYCHHSDVENCVVIKKCNISIIEKMGIKSVSTTIMLKYNPILQPFSNFTLL